MQMEDEEVIMEQITIGLYGEASITVTDELTADAVGSGSVHVYATPSMIGLMESAAIAAIDHLLPDGQTSVGIQIDVEHISATPVGEEVRARAEVIDVDGRKVIFEVQAWDEREMIGEGLHTRFVIDIDRFLEQLRRADDEDKANDIDFEIGGDNE